MILPKYDVLFLLLLSTAAHGGILVTQSEKGLTFADAVVLSVNGRDRVLQLGAQPKIAGPIAKLPSTKLSGTVLKVAATNTLALYGQGGVNYILPDGLPKGAAAGEPASLWRTAKITYKKAPGDKTPSEVAADAFVAFLPDGAEALSGICLDQQALALLGGNKGTLRTQLDWIAAVVGAYPGSTAMLPIQHYVEWSMRERYKNFEAGTAGGDSLAEGLKFADLSQAIYPNAAEQDELRKSLRNRKAEMDRKIAILLSFVGAEEWDAFLLGYRDFEHYQQAFPDIRAKHGEALKRSLLLHNQVGDARAKDGEYGAAWREFRLAALRQPSDRILRQKVDMAWTEYSSRIATERQRDRKQLKLSERDAINRALDFANRYKDANKLEEAMKSVGEAERVDADSLPVILKKAELLGIQRLYGEALKTLEEYDKRAVGDERGRAIGLRTDLEFKQHDAIETAKAEAPKALAEGRYQKLRLAVEQGLRAKDDDPDLLYYAGLGWLITRNTEVGRNYLIKYLELSNTLDGNELQRARARSLVARPPEGLVRETGEANWMSGKKLPKSVAYDPTSLAFQTKVEHIEASNKLAVTYEWTGDRLKSIAPIFEKADKATGERKISFAYEDRVPQVVAVGYEEGARVPASLDPDDILRNSPVILFNNPYVDPIAIQSVTGRSTTVGVAGNKFFHPFVWDKIHYFSLTYDANGRVSRAQEMPEIRGPLSDTWLEFEWDEMRLQAVRAFQGTEKQRIKTYERTLQYQDDRLISEEIQSQGKSSHIKYVYNASRLVSAECGNDMSLDGRSRKVFFSGGESVPAKRRQ